jgi:plastocyanin
MTLLRLCGLATTVVTTGLACGGDGGGSPSTTTTIAKANPSGDAQTDTVLATLPDPYRVLITRDGAPAQGVTVTWSVPVGQGSVSATSTTTGADGVASVTRTLGPTAGTQTAQASTAGAPAVSFSATAGAGNAAVLEMASGTARTGAVNGSLTHSARAEDAHGNPKQGVVIHWAVHEGSGTLLPTENATGGDGIAASTRTLGPDVGTYTDTATSAGLTGSPALITVNAIVPPATADVEVVNNDFNPDSVLIAVGGSVTWTWNSGGVLHNVTFAATTGAPANINNRASGSESRTFGTAGTFNYQCTLHVGMNGKVVVL